VKGVKEDTEKMHLFENSALPCGDRTKRHIESSYAYWRDSERGSMIAIRQLLESWFAEIPTAQQLDLQQRFRSPIERQHKSALFELFLHHFILRCGFQVEFHPDIEGVNTHPDFLVNRNGQALFYLEAIAVSDSTQQEAENKRIAQVYDTLNTLNSPDFYLGVRVDGAPDTPPAGAKLRRDLERWLSGLDWETVQCTYSDERYDRIPSYKWCHEGWEVLFEPIPKSEAARGTQAVQSIGLTMPMHAMQLNLDREIKEAVITKDRYGNVKLPFVVAVQVIHDFAIKKIDVMDGLLGAVLDLSCNRRPQAPRDPSGAWFSPQGPKHTNISAVLAWPTLEPWKFTAVEPIMVHHPCAAHPLPGDALPITQYIVDQERRALVEQTASSMENILGLSPNWVPED
jgi:hypothetical protein